MSEVTSALLDREMARARKEADQLISQRLRAYRRAAGVSVAVLARELGYNPASLYKIETGKAALPASLIVPVCRVIRCTPNQLLGL